MELNEALEKLNKAGLIAEARWPDNEERAEDDGTYMGSYYKYYDLPDPCTDEEWAEAGKQWAQDMLNNGEYSQDEYEDAMMHYEDYGY